MKTRMFKSLSIGIPLLATFPAYGLDVYFGLSGIYWTDLEKFTNKTLNQSLTVVNTKDSPLDGKIGLTIRNVFYLGGIYHYGQSSSFDSSDSKTLTSTRQAQGVSLGLIRNGWQLIGHYYLSASKKNPTSTITAYKKGSGFQVDGGYAAPIGKNLMLGFIVSYRNFSYEQIEDAQYSYVANVTEAELLPQVALWLKF
jgi:hypothetical protein